MTYGIDFSALRPISAFDSAIQGVEAGRAYRKERDTQSAFATYATDPEAGYKAMMAVDPKTGLALRDDAMAQATASRRKQVASLYRENPQAARDAAIAGGDFDLVTEFGKLDDQQRARAKESVELLAGIAAGLKTKPYEQRKPILAAAKPYLLERGLKPEQIDSFDPTDPNLDALTGQVLDLKTQMEMAQPDIRQSGRHVAGIDKATGQQKWAYSLPTDPEYKSFNRDDDVYRVGGEPGVGTGGSPAGAGGAPTPTGSPRNQRNNNPGNIEDGDFARSLPGYKGSDGRFAIFETPDAGRAAQARLLQSYGARGFNTVDKIINRWAPPSDNNDTAAYVRFVAQKVGVDPSQPLDLANPEVAGRVAAAIEQFEGGGAAKPYQVAANGATPAPPGMTLVRPGQPKQDDAPSGYRWGPDGTTLEAIPGGPGKGAGPVKLPPPDSKFLSETRTAANQAQEMARKANRFLQLNKKFATGPGYMGPVGVAARVNPEYAEMASIVDNLVPAMRQGLPGAASDRDVAMFRSATVGTDKLGTVNQNIVTAVNAAARRQQNYVAFMEDYAKQNGNLLGAQEEWSAYAEANPLYDEGKNGQLVLLKQMPWREWFGSPEQPRAAPQKAPQARPAQARPQQAQQKTTTPAAPPAGSRQPNTVYQTPRGPLKWTGTGWVQP